MVPEYLLDDPAGPKALAREVWELDWAELSEPPEGATPAT